MALTGEPGAVAGDERGLVLAARRGGAEAREALARRARRPAYLFALQLTGNRDDALDVAQEALLKFFETLPRFDAERPVKPWLLTIVRNCARDMWRRRRVRRAEPLDAGGGELARAIVDPASNPERDAARAELKRRVWRAIAGLGDAAREVLVLRDFHDLSYAEIAEVTGIPIGTVMSRLHRARRELARRLAPGGGEGHV